MTQSTNLIALSQAIGTDIGTLFTNQGQLQNLTTSAKANIVAALNELNASIAGAGASINDAAPSTSAVYSSSKTEQVANAAASALISDGAASGTKTYSSSKIDTQINAAITALIDGAPEAYDTFKELADYVASDTTAVGAMTASINNRVRFDATQALTAPQQLTVCENIGIGDPTTDFVAAYTTAKA